MAAVPLLLAASLLVASVAGHAPVRVASDVSATQAARVVAAHFTLGTPKTVTSVTPTDRAHPSWNILYSSGATALVDKISGEILDVSALPTLASARGTLSPDGAVGIARQLIAAVDPARASLTQLDPLRTPQVVHNAIQVSFTRVVNGVLFPANGFRVTINPNRSIQSYQVSWDDQTTFPSASAVISAPHAIRQATTLLAAHPHALLFYYLLPGSRTPRLLYLVKTSYGEVPLYASTGRPVDPANPQPDPAPAPRTTTPAVSVERIAQGWPVALAFLLGTLATLAGSRLRPHRATAPQLRSNRALSSR